MPRTGPRPVETVEAAVFADADILDDPATALDAAVEAVEPQPAVQVTLPGQSLSATVQALHADEVAMGFLHAGGHCGCRYIVTTAFQFMGVEVQA